MSRPLAPYRWGIVAPRGITAMDADELRAHWTALAQALEGEGQTGGGDTPSSPGGPILDLGCGDAAFALRLARAHPQRLIVAIDPDPSRMREVVAQATRKPAKGGAPNLLALRGSAEELPHAFAGAVAELFILYPWAALLRTLVEPDPAMLSRIASTLAPVGHRRMLLNAAVLDATSGARDARYADLDAEGIRSRLTSTYAEAGLVIDRVEWLAPGSAPPYRTTWGSRLVRGSGRPTWWIEGYRAR